MKILNKRARHHYKILEEIEAGISLTGAEVKALRAGKANISQSHGKIIGQEAFLVNANISTGEKPTRTRKLLLHKREIVSLSSKIKAKKLTLIPLKIYTKGRLIKVKLALAKSKRKFEKKESLKKADIKREIERELRGRH